ncbi:MAG: MazG nucleotide pyrophosphohydrolase domain-containing protein [Nitrososphaeria archaeon]
MEIKEAQEIIKYVYFHKDSMRGLEKTFIWFIEEVGELANAIKKGSKKDIEREISDVFAWLLSLANLLDISVEIAFISKYDKCCPSCKQAPCKCLTIN